MLRGSRSWVHRQHTGPGRALCAQNGKESEHGRTLRYLCPRPALAAPPVAPAVMPCVTSGLCSHDDYASRDRVTTLSPRSRNYQMV